MEKKAHNLKPLLILWLIISAILIFSTRDTIITRAGWDPDDQLRLVQLRDFLGGQSWFDTSQYRLNPPTGAPMHWSRLIELPLALVVLMTRPFFGQDVAEMTACAVVPLVTLGLLAYILGRIATRLGDRKTGIIAIFLTLSSTTLLPQMQPGRIDHHGWQIVLAALSLWTMFWPDKKRGGIVLGLALATWMHISLEGLPAAAAFFVLLGWRWIIEKAHGQRLVWTIGSFALATVGLFFGTQGHPFSALPYCDTISPPYVLAIVLAAGIMLPAIGAKPENRIWRIAAAVAAAGAAVAAILSIAPQCAHGAFGNLDPLVRDYWYAHINEGLPVWHQDIRDALIWLAPAVCAIPAYIALHRRAVDEKAIQDLRISGYFLIYAILISLLVFRTVAVAGAFAIPLVAVWISRLFEAYKASPSPVARVSMVALMLFLLVPGALVAQAATMLGGIIAKPETAAEKANEIATDKCESVRSIATLSALPRGNFVAPFDIGPAILMTTPHSVLASSHHRNERGMHDHIEIFRSAPDTSLTFIKAHRINYIAACPGEAELELYAEKHPRGLWGLLSRGQTPAWLEKMPDMGKGIKVWRVLGGTR